VLGVLLVLERVEAAQFGAAVALGEQAGVEILVDQPVVVVDFDLGLEHVGQPAGALEQFGVLHTLDHLECLGFEVVLDGGKEFGADLGVEHQLLDVSELLDQTQDGANVFDARHRLHHLLQRHQQHLQVGCILRNRVVEVPNVGNHRHD